MANCTKHTSPGNNPASAYFRIAALNPDMGLVFADCLAASVPASQICSNLKHQGIGYQKAIIIHDKASSPFSSELAYYFSQAWQAKQGKASVDEREWSGIQDTYQQLIKEAYKQYGAKLLVVFIGQTKDSKDVYEFMRAAGNAPQAGYAVSESAMNIGDNAADNGQDSFAGYLRQVCPKTPTSGECRVFSLAPLRNLHDERYSFDQNGSNKAHRDQFLAAYSAHFKNNNPSPYSAAGYDVAQIIMQTMKNTDKVTVPDPPAFLDQLLTPYLSSDRKAQTRQTMHSVREDVITTLHSSTCNSGVCLTGQYQFEPNGDVLCSSRDAQCTDEARKDGYQPAVSIFAWDPEGRESLNGWAFE